MYHQYTPVMLAYIPAPWILWDMVIKNPMTDPNGAAICLVCQPDPINVSPSHVSIFLPARAGSVMGMVSTVRGGSLPR